MLKRLRTAHPILYCILSEVLFLGSMVVFSLLATIVLAAAGADFDTMDGYLFGSVQEAVGLAVAVYLIPTVFLLRKKKLPEVQLYWGGIVKN